MVPPQSHGRSPGQFSVGLYFLPGQVVDVHDVRTHCVHFLQTLFLSESIAYPSGLQPSRCLPGCCLVRHPGSDR
jgi:hypothetical protein